MKRKPTVKKLRPPKELSPKQMEKLFKHVEKTIKEVDRDNDRIQQKTFWISFFGVVLAVLAFAWAFLD